jgi:hypothetical protein
MAEGKYWGDEDGKKHKKAAEQELERQERLKKEKDPDYMKGLIHNIKKAAVEVALKDVKDYQYGKTTPMVESPERLEKQRRNQEQKNASYTDTKFVENKDKVENDDAKNKLLWIGGFTNNYQGKLKVLSEILKKKKQERDEE